MTAIFDWKEKFAPPVITRGGGIPDPRTLLVQPSDRVLMGYVQAQGLRSALAQGQIKGSPGVLCLLHLLFVELVPDPQEAVAACLSEPLVAVEISQHKANIKWMRPHFIHPVVYPLTPLTAYHLGKFKVLPMALNVVKDETVESLKAWLVNVGFPADTEMSFDTMIEWAASYKRLTMSPSLLVAAHPKVEGPTFNLRSLARLVGDIPPDRKAVSVHTSRRLRGQQVGEDIKALSEILNLWRDQDRRLGEQRQRALGASRAICQLDTPFSPGAVWLKEWLLDELERSALGVRGCYRLSSIYTYFGSLHRGAAPILGATDPYEWETEDWVGYIRCLSGSKHFSQMKTGEVPEDVTHACRAMLGSLRRRRVSVPSEVQSKLKGDAEADVELPSDSASAVLVSAQDVESALHICLQMTADRPLIGLLVKLRASLATTLPLRSGDISSLSKNCLTPAGGIVIKRVGFSNHKTESTIRVVPIRSENSETIKRLSNEIVRFTKGGGDLLLRDRGDPVGVERDNEAIELWTQALKVATGDPKARPHSLRATTLQNWAWPGWQTAAAPLLLGHISVAEAVKFIAGVQVNWMTVAQAGAAAGHADLRAAVGNYLSAWPLVHALFARAKLQELTPGPDLLKGVGIHPEALRQARSRNSRNQEPVAVGSWSDWDWLFRKLRIRFKGQGPTQARPTPETPRADLIPVQPIKTATPVSLQVLYLTLRCFDMTTEEASERINLPWREALSLEKKLPDKRWIEFARQRSKAPSSARAMSSNIQVCLGDQGQRIRDWVLSLPNSEFHLLAKLFIRDYPCPPEMWQIKIDWVGLTSRLPEGMHLNIYKGAAHIQPDELLFSQRVGLRYTLRPDTRLGARPKMVLFPVDGNRVVTAWLTALARITFLVFLKLKESNHED